LVLFIKPNINKLQTEKVAKAIVVGNH
jgi:hypothetical protein